MVSALLILGRGREAQARFHKLLPRANDVGLYAEEADTETHAFLGNHPQALTHLTFIEPAVNLDLYNRKGVRGLKGGPAERAKRAVGATGGSEGSVGRVDQDRARRTPALVARLNDAPRVRWMNSEIAGRESGPCYFVGPIFFGVCSALNPLLSLMCFAIAAGFVFDGSYVISAVPFG